jgi:hypothetical protein
LVASTDSFAQGLPWHVILFTAARETLGALGRFRRLAGIKTSPDVVQVGGKELKLSILLISGFRPPAIHSLNLRICADRLIALSRASVRSVNMVIVVHLNATG